mmetsp:Transcript_11258/g.25366  ORF Transcript_11258/g.25366 Transcript_11258/m.25366 type:complete len:265 (-) Transcript_11258:36-830(-)
MPSTDAIASVDAGVASLAKPTYRSSISDVFGHATASPASLRWHATRLYAACMVSAFFFWRSMLTAWMRVGRLRSSASFFTSFEAFETSRPSSSGIVLSRSSASKLAGASVKLVSTCLRNMRSRVPMSSTVLTSRSFSFFIARTWSRVRSPELICVLSSSATFALNASSIILSASSFEMDHCSAYSYSVLFFSSGRRPEIPISFLMADLKRSVDIAPPSMPCSFLPMPSRYPSFSSLSNSAGSDARRIFVPKARSICSPSVQYCM